MRPLVPTLAAAALLAAAAPPPATPLPPSTKWRLDYAPTECRLLRSFGAGADEVTIQFSKLTPDPAIEVALVGRRFPATDRPVPARLTTTTVPAVEAHAQGHEAGGGMMASLRFRPNRALADAFASDAASGRPTRLGIGFVRGYGLALDLGRMKAPLAGLDKCVDDLVSTWGLDPAEQRARTRAAEPVGSPAEWFRPSDFPASLNAIGTGGVVVVRLGVGADGAVTNCAVAKAGGDKAFEELTCRLVRERARFTPALGAAGRPIASVWSSRVVWQPAKPFVRTS